MGRTDVVRRVEPLEGRTLIGMGPTEVDWSRVRMEWGPVGVLEEVWSAGENSLPLTLQGKSQHSH